MNIGVVTTYNRKLYDEYAKRFLETYNWPFDLKIYVEEDDFWHPKFTYKNIFKEVSDCKEFVNRNKHRMKQSDYKEKSTAYVKDGVRFCYKVYAYTDFVMNNEDYDGIICIDADSVFYKPIDVNWIKEHIHRDDCMMTYLGRPNYSECGFLYFNMKHKETKHYAKIMKDMYDTDHIYDLKEQHDSFIWDYVRLRFENDKGVINHNIGDDKVGHVQARSILGEIYDHTKGSRKLKGRSPEARV
jgi:hypothetical protein